MGEWQQRTPPVPIGEEAHVWLVRLAPERSRENARRAVREIAGAYLGCAPEELELIRDAGGKPRIAGDPLQVSLSHSGELALVAIAARARLGVDLERIREVSEERIAARWFSEQESRAIAAAPAQERSDLFFACWTRKEALVKATGEGIAGAFSDFAVPLGRDMAPAPLERAGGRWALFDLDPAPGYRAALAIEADREPPPPPLTLAPV